MIDFYNMPESKAITYANSKAFIHIKREAILNLKARISSLQLKEYNTRGNTPKCQQLFKLIEDIDEELAKREREEA